MYFWLLARKQPFFRNLFSPGPFVGSQNDGRA
jgi:hypothetical protein